MGPLDTRTDPDNPNRSFFDRTLDFTTLLVVMAAPLCYGCYQPWAAGFLVAAVAVLAAIGGSARFIQRRTWLPMPAGVQWTALLLAGWFSLVVAHDFWMGTEAGHAPSVSLRVLPYLGAFIGAASLGSRFGASEGQFRTALRCAIAIGTILAIFSLIEASGVKVRPNHLGIPGRYSGLYINANRFAVMMAITLCCGLALILAEALDLNSWRIHKNPAVLLLMPMLVVVGTSLVLTISRLTLACLALSLCLAAVLWMRWLSPAATKIYPWDELDIPPSPAERIRNAVRLAMPLTVLAGFTAWIFIIGEHKLTERLNEIGRDPSAANRLRAALAGLPLIASAPVFGHGLGTFDSIFPSVQPAALVGRWRQMHCDWLQTAVEAGLPALVLMLAAAGAWLVAVWRQMRGSSADDRSGKVLRLLPLAGLATALLCSGADFPLREPGTAMLFFFLAGALAYRSPRQNDSTIARFAFPLILPFLLASAFIAGRNAFACALTPWKGQVQYPPVTGKDPAPWLRGAQADPGDPELPFNAARAVLELAKPSGEQLEQAFAAASTARSLNPADYRFAWMQAEICERQERIEDALKFQEEAIALAPFNTALHEDMGRACLKIGSRYLVNDPRRAELMSRCAAHFRAVLDQEPEREADLVKVMEWSDCLNDEIVQLWAGDSNTMRLRRARFYCRASQFDMVDRTLPPEPPQEPQEACWYHTIMGTLHLRRGDAEAAVASWDLALKAGTQKPRVDPAVEAWIAAEVPAMVPSDREKLARASLDDMRRYPQLATVLAKSLISANRLVAADELLADISHLSPELMSMWAELALQTGDTAAASTRADETWRMGCNVRGWGMWYDAFLSKVEKRRTPEPPSSQTKVAR